MPYSSGGRPATAFSPMLGISLALVHPDVAAVVLPDELRREVDVLGREAAVEQVRRLDDVVVDAHQDHVVETHAVPLVCC